ncbi:MAG: hypothetical protein MPK62_03975, partial [Alphaproteobacteria bacterium]|nr:hypothetical protein [Alphaproteobacteria bacterium]
MCIRDRQVKTSTTFKGWRIDADDFLNIEQNGDRQTVRGKKEITRNLIYVFVYLGMSLRDDELYFIPAGKLQDIIHDSYKNYMESRDGVRQRNPSSRHYLVGQGDTSISDYFGKWEVINEVAGLE